MVAPSALHSASSWLSWSNALYVGGAALTVVSAAYVFYEKRLIASGKQVRHYLLSESVVLFAAFVSLVGTIGAIHFGGVVSRLKDADLTAYKTSADLQIAQSNESARKAERDFAIVNQKAEEARLKADNAEQQNAKLRIDLARGEAESRKAEAELAAQNQKTLQFTQALQMQQENMAQQMHVSPVLNDAQVAALSERLKSFAGEDVILHSTLDTTVLRTEYGVAKALDGAGIKHSQSSMDAGALYRGISVVVHAQTGHPPLADALIYGLKDAGILAQPVALDSVPQGKVAIYFGPY